MSKKFIKLAFVIYIALLLYLTIFSREMRILYVDFQNQSHLEWVLWNYTHISNWRPFDSINMYLNISSYSNSEFLYNVIGNIIAFIPFTFLGGFIFKHSYTSLLYAFLTTWAIEISQLLLMCGSFDIDDVILNLSGAVIGFLVYHLFNFILNKLIHIEKAYQN